MRNRTTRLPLAGMVVVVFSLLVVIQLARSACVRAAWAAESSACTGDCYADGSVTVDEILTMVNIALGDADVDACPVGDRNGDGTITVDEILVGVNNALNGCPATPTPTPTPIIGSPTPTAPTTPSATPLPPTPPPTTASPSPTASSTSGGLPPDPAAVAPPLAQDAVTDLHAATAFLYAGPNPIQTGVTSGMIVAPRAAVIRGKVLDRDMHPLSGATIAILGHAEYGQTLSRTDGMFDLAVNGGGPLSITYTKTGFLPAQRMLTVPWQDFAMAPDVCLIPVDAHATTVGLGAASPAQMALGGVATDNDGTRRATLFFPPGTQAELVLPDGSTQPAPQLTVHATEYTVGPNGKLAMPAELPPTSAYTYAVAFTADEAVAAGATGVRFNVPVFAYVENFLDIPVGAVVPSGSYDHTRGAWMAEDNGRVIQIVSVTDTAADLDANGDGSADDTETLAALGISDAERQQLATLYTTGQTLWRVPLAHLSDLDFNYPPMNTDDPPPTPPANNTAPLDHNCHIHGGSVLECQDQILDEAVNIVGTPFMLHYTSDRVPGRAAGRSLDLAASGPTVPRGLSRIETEVMVAGRVFEQTFPPEPNQQLTFTWDGRDAYGRRTQGIQPATVRITYVYDGLYAVPPADYRAFARFGSGPLLLAHTSRRFELGLGQDVPVQLGGWDARGQGGLGGWTLSIHHAYDPIGRVLHLGTGERRSEEDAVAIGLGFAGNGGIVYPGDGQPATAAGVRPFHVATGPDGSVYFNELAGFVRRVNPDGTITTVAGAAQYTGSCAEGIPAIQADLAASQGYLGHDVAVGPDGLLYIALRQTCDGHDRSWIRRVDADGTIHTVAGGDTGFSGDGGPALAARFNTPAAIAFGNDGTLYVADYGNARIRRIGPEGMVTTAAGNGQPCLYPQMFCNVPGPASLMGFNTPNSEGMPLAVGPDGSLLVALSINSPGSQIVRITPDGQAAIVAGDNSSNNNLLQDGDPVLLGRLGFVQDVDFAPDGSWVYSESLNGIAERVRRVTPDGIGRTVAGATGQSGFGGDAGPATQALFSIPEGVSYGPDGSLYIVDRGNFRVRRLTTQLPGVTFGDFLIPSEDGSEVYHFDTDGRHLDTHHALTGAVLYQFDYDSGGGLAHVTDGDGNVTTIERDAGGAPTAIVGPYGQRTSLAVDANGFLASIGNPANEARQFSYTADGLLTQQTDPKSQTSHYEYDALGRLTRAEDRAGGTQTLALTPLDDGREVARTTKLGRTTTYDVELLADGQRRQRIILPDVTTIETTSTSDARTNVTFPDGSSVSQLQGPDPRFGMLAPLVAGAQLTMPSRITLATSETKTVTLSDPTNVFSLIASQETATRNGRASTSLYNAASRQLIDTTPGGRTATAILDALGRPVSAQIGGLVTLALDRDAHGRLTRITEGPDADTRATLFAYDAHSYLQSITDALGRVTSFAYDAAGRVISQTLPDGRTIALTYDANGNIVALTPPGGLPHTFSYSPADLMTAYTPPDVSGITHPETTVSFNADRQPTLVSRPDGRSVGFTYDSAGRLASLAFSRGSVTLTYESATGRLSGVSAPDGIGHAFVHDGALLLSESLSGPVAGGVASTYDADFRVASQSVDGGNVATFAYDADSLLTRAGALTLSRDGQSGLLTATALDAVTDTVTYNAHAEVVDYRALVSGSEIYRTQLTRDALGRITQKVETIQGTSATYDYSYDLAGRLVGVAKNGAPGSSYSYDGNSNRLAYGGPLGTVAATQYDAQDRLLQYGGATYAYNASGDLVTKTVGNDTTQYTYDEFGNLTRVVLPDTTQIDYVIDGLNRRIGKKVNGALVKGWLYDGQLRVVAELDGAGNVLSRFVYGIRNVPDYMVRNATTYRIVTDYLGSPRLLIDSSTGAVAGGMNHDEYGRVTQDDLSDAIPFGFAGGLYDPDTGLVRFGARDYDAASGRWASKDPLLLHGFNTNAYSYVRNDPVNSTDRSGRDDDDPSAGLAPFDEKYMRWLELASKCRTAEEDKEFTEIQSEIAGWSPVIKNLLRQKHQPAPPQAQPPQPLQPVPPPPPPAPPRPIRPPPQPPVYGPHVKPNDPGWIQVIEQ